MELARPWEGWLRPYDLAGLDLPNFTHFPVHFVEHYSSPRYPAENIDTSKSPIVFPWERMQAALDADPAPYAVRSYLHEDGSEGEFCTLKYQEEQQLTIAPQCAQPTVSRILGGSAARLDPGARSSMVQETASSVYHVVDGSCYSIIDGKRFDWNRGDTFCIPSWKHMSISRTRGRSLLICIDLTTSRCSSRWVFIAPQTWILRDLSQTRRLCRRRTGIIKGLLSLAILLSYCRRISTAHMADQAHL
jgi:mannose-6-phosphate isomerase-like protein (cupin superfamily)